MSNPTSEEVHEKIAEMANELMRLREIVCEQDVESIDRVLGRSSCSRCGENRVIYQSGLCGLCENDVTNGR